MTHKNKIDCSLNIKNFLWISNILYFIPSRKFSNQPQWVFRSLSKHRKPKRKSYRILLVSKYAKSINYMKGKSLVRVSYWYSLSRRPIGPRSTIWLVTYQKFRYLKLGGDKGHLTRDDLRSCGLESNPLGDRLIGTRAIRTRISDKCRPSCPSVAPWWKICLYLLNLMILIWMWILKLVHFTNSVWSLRIFSRPRTKHKKLTLILGTRSKLMSHKGSSEVIGTVYDLFKSVKGNFYFQFVW